MIQLAVKDECTGCGACAFRCPKRCITMRENEIGIVLPVLDVENCVECHQCENVCPILNPLEMHEPLKAYASWSTNEEERRTSASGGVAAEMYRFALKNGYNVVGASQNADFSVTHKIIGSECDLLPLKNSKYVFSDAYDVYPKIRELLKNGQKILFIGLPCQVASFRRLFKDDDQLLLAEVVCHGTTPLSYLKQHIADVEKNQGTKARKMSFREPSFDTHTYYLSMFDENDKLFYAKRTKEGDLYQYGYHRTISYRENCYHCSFAKRQRVSDITLSDYKGLGKMAPCQYGVHKVSSVLVNTDKGSDFFEKLVSSGQLFTEERPVLEPINGDPQLRHPSLKKKGRFEFERSIVKKNGDFVAAIKPIAEKGLKEEYKNAHPSFFKRVIKKLKSLVKS